MLEVIKSVRLELLMIMARDVDVTMILTGAGMEKLKFKKEEEISSGELLWT